ncbi:PTS sugar transporter subunit IIC [Aerococcus christensenii]|uniref:PTS sugar transporter subunit IIC n=1 Tax=Aerococcus christensenii TaxID=87541 RepID=UPI003F442A9F
MQNTSFIDKMSQLLGPVSEKVGNQRHLQAISKGMMFSLPFLVIGSLFLIVANPPINIDAYQPETANVFWTVLAQWKFAAMQYYDYLTAPFNLTVGMIGLISCFGIAHALAEYYRLNPAINGMVASTIFLLVCTPIQKGKIQLDFLGTNGLFIAIIIALCVVEVNQFFEKRGIQLKLPDSIPSMVATFVNTLLPLLVNIVIFYGINLISIAYFGKMFPEVVMNVLTPATSAAGSLPGFLLIVTFGNLLWLFGVNGSSIIFPIVFTLGITETGMNAELCKQGAEMTHLMNLQMFRISVLGGAGGTLGLILLMIRSKVPELKTLGKLALLPGICSINEPIIFGLPIVFNPVLAIPFLMVPIVSLVLTYYAQKIGLIGLGYIVDPSFTPFFMQSFLSSMDLRNVVFAFILILISAGIYYPFFKVIEKQKLAQINVKE